MSNPDLKLDEIIDFLTTQCTEGKSPPLTPTLTLTLTDALKVSLLAIRLASRMAMGPTLGPPQRMLGMLRIPVACHGLQVSRMCPIMCHFSTTLIRNNRLYSYVTTTRQQVLIDPHLLRICNRVNV